MIQEAGFYGEEHKVVTPDGYILSVHRVTSPEHVNTPGRQVVFLQHGILCSSAVWLIGDRTKAFGEKLYISCDMKQQFHQLVWYKIAI